MREEETFTELAQRSGLRNCEACTQRLSSVFILTFVREVN